MALTGDGHIVLELTPQALNGKSVEELLAISQDEKYELRGRFTVLCEIVKRQENLLDLLSHMTIKDRA